jgi:hypothetical protein
MGSEEDLGKLTLTPTDNVCLVVRLLLLLYLTFKHGQNPCQLVVQPNLH